MTGQLKCRSFSWIVPATGPLRGAPTGWTNGQIHPDCLRQIENSSANILESPERLREWLAKTAGKTMNMVS